jgi:hypothetical protein
LWDGLAAQITAEGYTLERGDCGGANGRTYFDAKVVRVRDDVDDAQMAKSNATSWPICSYMTAASTRQDAEAAPRSKPRASPT